MTSDQAPMTPADYALIGIPMGEADEDEQWSPSLATSTVTDMAAGHPRAGVSPWSDRD
jgi:hypothetical protein